MRRLSVVLLALSCGCESEDVRYFHRRVSEPPSLWNSTDQLDKCRDAPKGAATADLDRCRSYLAPTHYHEVEADLDKQDRGLACMVAVRAVIVGDRADGWWRPARNKTFERCCSPSRDEGTTPCAKLPPAGGER